MTKVIKSVGSTDSSGEDKQPDRASSAKIKNTNSKKHKSIKYKKFSDNEESDNEMLEESQTLLIENRTNPSTSDPTPIISQVEPQKPSSNNKTKLIDFNMQYKLQSHFNEFKVFIFKHKIDINRGVLKLIRTTDVTISFEEVFENRTTQPPPRDTNAPNRNANTSGRYQHGSGKTTTTDNK